MGKPDSKRINIDDAYQILQENRIEDLINVEETNQIEFREFPYLTTNADAVTRYKAKQTLVEDFSSIANSGGGLIIIGMQTIEKDGIKVEITSKMCPINKTMLDVKSWKALIKQHTYPNIDFDSMAEYGFSGQNDEIFWLKIKDAKTLGIYPIMFVSDQWKPEKEIHIKGEVYGIYHRSDTTNELLSPMLFHKHLSNALEQPNVNAEPISIALSKLMNIEKLLTKEVINRTKETEELLKEKTDYLVTELCAELGSFYIIAVPKDDVTINNFWIQEDNTVYKLIEDPPRLRRMGWDLCVSSIERPASKDNGWENRNGCRKLIRLEENGTFIVGVSINEFLNWGTERHEIESGLPVLVNLIALTEFVTVFCTVLEKLQNIHSKVDYDIHFGFKGTKDYQYKIYFTKGSNHIFSSQEGILDKKEWKAMVKFKMQDNQSDYALIMAAQILQKILKGGFEITNKENLFFDKTENGTYKVNKEAIIALK